MKKKLLYLLLTFSLFLTSCQIEIPWTDNIIDSTEENNIIDTKDNLIIHYIDVGQADATLIVSPKGTILIDAGDNGTSDQIVTYIKDLGIKKIDLLFATHPHSDHIGGMSNVIKNFEIGKIYMPKALHTTVTFENFLKAMQEKEIQPIIPTHSDKINFGNLKITILNPIREEYDNLNNYSISMKMTYFDTSFIFAGDSEKLVENDILAKGINLSADVYKVSHHGSSTSTSEAFLEAISPKIAIISCGFNNDYGHPHKEILARLNKNNINIFRTDEIGTVTIISNGKSIYLENNNTNLLETTIIDDSLLRKYLDKNGVGSIKGNINSKGVKIYHMPDGAYYEKTKAELYFQTEKEAVENGFRKSSK